MHRQLVAGRRARHSQLLTSSLNCASFTASALTIFFCSSSKAKQNILPRNAIYHAHKWRCGRLRRSEVSQPFLLCQSRIVPLCFGFCGIYQPTKCPVSPDCKFGMADNSVSVLCRHWSGATFEIPCIYCWHERLSHCQRYALCICPSFLCCLFLMGVRAHRVVNRLGHLIILPVFCRCTVLCSVPFPRRIHAFAQAEVPPVK